MGHFCFFGVLGDGFSVHVKKGAKTGPSLRTHAQRRRGAGASCQGLQQRLQLIVAVVCQNAITCRLQVCFKTVTSKPGRLELKISLTIPAIFGNRTGHFEGMTMLLDQLGSKVSEATGVMVNVKNAQRRLMYVLHSEENIQKYHGVHATADAKQQM